MAIVQREIDMSLECLHGEAPLGMLIALVN